MSAKQWTLNELLLLSKRHLGLLGQASENISSHITSEKQEKNEERNRKQNKQSVQH